jgi:tetratricopeptide (TPR) repeat protein
VNATPELSQATTSSLDALRKYSEASRANLVGDPRSVTLAREAVALDSTFASAWNTLGAMLSNYGGSRSAIDSALTQAYRFRDKLPPNERDRIIGRYFALGPGRDRVKAIAAYEAILQRGDSAGTMVNLGESVRSRREFARAESLNLATLKISPGSGTALGNAAEMQLNQGKFEEAAATVARLRQVSAAYGMNRQSFTMWVRGQHKELRALSDTLRRRSDNLRSFGLFVAHSLATIDGRLRDAAQLRREANDFERTATRPEGLERAPAAEETVWDVATEAWILGSSPAIAARIQAAIDRVPLREMAMVDRPYLGLASVLAITGNPDKARAMLARYRAEVTDTAILREQEADLHSVLGEIALAENRPIDALVEFRRGDIGYDGRPADECAPCLSFDLARAFDAAGRADSAIVMYEQYLATPYWQKMSAGLDPSLVPKIRERLGQLYEQSGNTQKAAENYGVFVALWKSADPELQPRVNAARAKLRRMSLDAPR